MVVDVRTGAVSRREAEVLAELGERRSNAEIAAKLHISVRTVENHVASLLRKHGVADRRALAELATAAPDRVSGVPAALTTFIGRDSERGAVPHALEQARLVTLHGPGGIGKTRLAAAVAESFPGGGAFVDLVPARDGYVAQAVAAALGVTERSRQSLPDAIAGRLGGARSLLVLDNCEHVVDEVAGFAARLMARCPGVRMLATSRERLGVPGERTIEVEALPLGGDAEALFRDRAGLADPRFAADPATVTRICARLDGVPLAIELAAARIAALGADGVLAGLDDVLRLLGGGRGRDERHRSLRAVLDWSHDLLGDEERLLFRRLAVFAGGFDLDAAVAVTDVGARPAVADVLGRLADKSMLVRGRGGWRMLNTIRAFAAEQLPAAEADDLRRRHLEWAAATAADLDDRRGDRWREDFDAVADDLRAALALASPEPDPLVHRLARALAHLTFARRFLVESLGHYETAAARACSPADAARDLRDAAGCAHFIDFSGGRAYTLLVAAARQAGAAGDGNTQAIALARAVELAARYPGGYPTGQQDQLLEDAARVGDSTQPAVAAALATASVWSTAREKLKPDPAAAWAAERAARVSGDPVLINATLDAVRTAATTAGRLRDAHRVSAERLALLTEIDRDDPRAAVEIEDTYNMACTDALAVGDLRTALAVAEEAQRDDLVGSHPYLSTGKMITALALTGQLHEAVRQATAMWEAWQRLGRPPAGWTSPAMPATALACGLLGDDEAFHRWRARAAEVAGARPGDRYRHLTFTAFADARVAVHNASTAGREAIVERAFTGLPTGWFEPYARAAGAELAVVARLPDAERRLAAAASAADENDWAAACLARARGRLGDLTALETALEGWNRIGASFEHAYTLTLLPDRPA